MSAPTRPPPPGINFSRYICDSAISSRQLAKPDSFDNLDVAVPPYDVGDPSNSITWIQASGDFLTTIPSENPIDFPNYLPGLSPLVPEGLPDFNELLIQWGNSSNTPATEQTDIPHLDADASASISSSNTITASQTQGSQPNVCALAGSPVPLRSPPSLHSPLPLSTSRGKAGAATVAQTDVEDAGPSTRVRTTLTGKDTGGSFLEEPIRCKRKREKEGESDSSGTRPNKCPKTAECFDNPPFSQRDCAKAKGKQPERVLPNSPLPLVEAPVAAVLGSLNAKRSRLEDTKDDLEVDDSGPLKKRAKIRKSSDDQLLPSNRRSPTRRQTQRPRRLSSESVIHPSSAINTPSQGISLPALHPVTLSTSPSGIASSSRQQVKDIDDSEGEIFHNLRSKALTPISMNYSPHCNSPHKPSERALGKRRAQSPGPSEHPDIAKKSRPRKKKRQAKSPTSDSEYDGSGFASHLRAPKNPGVRRAIRSCKGSLDRPNEGSTEISPRTQPRGCGHWQEPVKIGERWRCGFQHRGLICHNTGDFERFHDCRRHMTSVHRPALWSCEWRNTGSRNVEQIAEKWLD